MKVLRLFQEEIRTSVNRWSLPDSCLSFQNLLSTATSLVYIYLAIISYTFITGWCHGIMRSTSPKTAKKIDGTTYTYIQRTLCSAVVYDQWGQHDQLSVSILLWHLIIYLCTPGWSIPWVVMATNEWPEHPSRFCINLKTQQELL